MARVTYVRRKSTADALIWRNGLRTRTATSRQHNVEGPRTEDGRPRSNSKERSSSFQRTRSSSRDRYGRQSRSSSPFRSPRRNSPYTGRRPGGYTDRRSSSPASGGDRKYGGRSPFQQRPLTCWNCGKRGHKATDCRGPKQSTVTFKEKRSEARPPSPRKEHSESPRGPAPRGRDRDSSRMGNKRQ